MNNDTNSPVCERAPDLMAFIYNEMNERESREFNAHLRSCSNCREEAESFGVVRESIGAWRDEVLTGFVPSTATPTRKSAVAAFKQFFDLSPLWLKGAAAFAVLTFCVFAGLLFVNSRKENSNASAVYTQQDVDRLVKEALAQQPTTPVENLRESTTTVATLNPAPPQQRNRPAVRKQTAARNRRPLSRAEREQLAADLRLLPTDDDLDLLGDRINQ